MVGTFLLANALDEMRAHSTAEFNSALTINNQVADAINSAAEGVESTAEFFGSTKLWLSGIGDSLNALDLLKAFGADVDSAINKDVLANATASARITEDKLHDLAAKIKTTEEAVKQNTDTLKELKTGIDSFLKAAKLAVFAFGFSLCMVFFLFMLIGVKWIYDNTDFKALFSEQPEQ